MINQKPDNICASDFLYKIFHPYRWYLCGWISVSMAWALDLSLRPYILSLITNHVSDKLTGIASSITMPVLLYSVATITSSIIIARLYNLVSLQSSTKIKKNISELLLNYIVKNPNELMQNKLTGSITSRINDLVVGVPAIASNIIDGLFYNSIAQVGTIITVSQVSYQFSIIIFLWISIVLSITLLSFKTSKKLSSATYDEWSRVSGRMVNILSNIMSIRFFTIRKHETSKFLLALDQASELEELKNNFFLKIYNFQALVFVAVQLFCLWILVAGTKTGITKAGDFSLILVVNCSIADSLYNISKAYLAFSDNIGKISQGLTLTSAPIKIDEEETKTNKLVAHSGLIVFEKVQFNYKGTTQYLYEKKLKIESGEKVALIGHAGNGKSTLINLLLGVFKLKSGEILIDSQNIKNVSQDSIASAVAIIPQDPPFFHGSIKENIRYAKKDATDEEIITAAKKALAHDFIINLKNGYNSSFGTEGVKLTLPEKRLLSITRAFLKDSPIIVLDGIVNGFDIETESEIQKNFWGLTKDKTVIIIAKRLNYIVSVNKILVFEQGKIIQEGTHSELMHDEHGSYKLIWDAQNKTFF